LWVPTGVEFTGKTDEDGAVNSKEREKGQSKEGARITHHYKMPVEQAYTRGGE